MKNVKLHICNLLHVVAS